MSSIGYYRYKTTLSLDSDIDLYINGELVATKTVQVREFCDNSQILKYLNKDGQYRFFPFNKYWERSDKPKEIGRTNKIITSLLNGQTSESSVGYRNERTLSLVAENLTQEELEILSDIWTSPKVYLYVGENDTVEDWIEITVDTKDTVSRIKKGNSKDFEIDVILPEWYSIGLL